jgi:hypothetical protein
MNEFEPKTFTGVLSGGIGAVAVNLVCEAFSDKLSGFVFVLICLGLVGLFLGLPRPLIFSFSFFDKSTLNNGTFGKLSVGKGTGSELSRDAATATGWMSSLSGAE